MSGIYISYRRMESAAYAGRLFDHLSRHFGRRSVFMDIDTIRRGEDFPQAIESALNACDVVLVVIGNTWATCTGQDGRRRLDDPKDWVRLEVAAALRRDILVVPVLVEGARLPDPTSLPEELRALCQRHACELTDLRWSYDVGELVKDLETGLRPPKRFKIPRIKDKRLRWLPGTAIILVLLVGVAIFWSTIFQKSSRIQNETASSAATEAISGAINLLAPENGGHVLVASSDDWAGTIDGKEGGKQISSGLGKSAVFGFKDERPATFDMFTMLIPETRNGNVKEFELLEGNESPTGSFQSIGKFQTQNVKLFEKPYQEFKFSPVTAKYLKVKILSTYEDWSDPWVFQFQLFGVLQANPPKVAASPVVTEAISGAINLLAPENGGHVLVASSDDWAGTIDGKEGGKQISSGLGKSAVFGFKDKRPATFDMFTMLIPETRNGNVKKFELLEGNESPTGSFQSIGKFRTQNVKLFEKPYQEFKFSPVTAKYLKVEILSTYEDWSDPWVFQFQLFGVLR
jgi:hypothetical protein